MRRTNAAVLVAFVWLIACSMAGIGLSTGYDASTESETDIYLDGEVLVVGENETNMSLDRDREPNPRLDEEVDDLPEFPDPTPDRFREPIQDGANATIEAMYWGSLEATVPIADATATWSYHNRGWFPAWVAKGMLNLAMLAPLAGIGWLVARRVEEVFR
jgi:hypothetical protein